MAVSRYTVWAASVMTLAGTLGPVPADAAQQQTTPAQQQQVPDAPRPQTVPRLNTIVPPAAAVPNAPAPTATTAPAPTTQADAPSSAGPGKLTAAQQAEEDAFIPPAGQGPVSIRTGISVVDVPFLVKDARGQLVPGLQPRDVEVYENGVRQQIKYFTADPFPLSVAFIIDQSVTFDTMQRINSALSALQGAFASYDEVAVFTYNNGVKMQDDRFDGATSPRLGAILERSKGKGREPLMPMGGPLSQTTMINNQQVDPNTAPNRSNPNALSDIPDREFHTLNDAILAGAVQLAKVDAHRRRIIYVISDGKEYGSVAKEKDVIRFCQTNKIAVYATLVGDSALPVVGFLDRIHLPLTMRDNVLPRYTSATGGQYDLEFRQKEIENSFAEIARESRSQYLVEFNTHLSPLLNDYRRLEVRVLRPSLHVYSKEGYYPTPDRRNAPPVPAPGPRVAPASTTAPANTPPLTPTSTN